MKSETIFILSALRLAAAAPTLTKRAGQPGAVSVRWGAAGFLGEFTIGGQAMDLLLDTGSCGMWVVGTDVSECSSQTHCYNPSNAEKVSSVSSFEQTYNDGLSAAGSIVVKDTFGAQSGGGFSIDSQYVQVADDIVGDYGDPLDEEKNGLLGMCRKGTSDSKPTKLDTLLTTSGNFDYFTSYVPNDDVENWSFCFGCMADSSKFDESSGVTVKATDSGHWYVDPSGWKITITQDGNTDTVSLSGSGDILLDTGMKATALDSNSITAIASAYGGSCSGSKCTYPCYVKEDGYSDYTPTKQDVTVTLPWGDGGIPFNPAAFVKGWKCSGGSCKCTLGLKTKSGGYTYGSGVYKSGYFKWDVANAEITMYRYK
ncbi:Rhizopuspepsin [Dactylella cylindrospora]|nr:Rhizopuspepsin [Dactylella cylindrospora]